MFYVNQLLAEHPHLCASLFSLNIKKIIIYASVRVNLTVIYKTTKGADQPTHPHSLIITFVVHYREIIVGKPVPCNISIFLLVSVAKQVGLSHTQSEALKTGFLMPGKVVNGDLHPQYLVGY